MVGWRNRCGLALIIAGLGAASPALADDRPVVTVNRDDVVITASCRVQCSAQPIADANGDGVVHIRGEGLHVTFESPLHGAPAGAAPDSFTGVGIAITGAGHTIERAAAHGFRVGILAPRCRSPRDRRRRRLRQLRPASAFDADRGSDQRLAASASQ